MYHLNLQFWGWEEFVMAASKAEARKKVLEKAAKKIATFSSDIVQKERCWVEEIK